MIHETAIVESDRISADATVAEYSIVRAGATLGPRVVIHPFVVIEAGVTLAEGVEVFPGAHIGKEPKGAGALARPLRFRRSVAVGKNCSIGPHAVIYLDVTIGDNTLIGDGASIREESRMGSGSVIGRHVTVNYNTIIGDRVKVMDHSWLAGNMEIEDDVFVSGGVLTANDNAVGRQGYDEEAVQGPHIESGAAIGLGAKILPGVRIGRRAIVGAAALVTRDVPPDTMVLGIPAKPVGPAGGDR